jgi:hypothetical protein
MCSSLLRPTVKYVMHMSNRKLKIRGKKKKESTSCKLAFSRHCSFSFQYPLPYEPSSSVRLSKRTHERGRVLKNNEKRVVTVSLGRSRNGRTQGDKVTKTNHGEGGGGNSTRDKKESES